MGETALEDRFHDLHRELREVVIDHGWESCLAALLAVEDWHAEYGDDFDRVVGEGLMAAVSEISAAQSRERRILIAEDAKTRLTWSWRPGGEPPSERFVRMVLASVVHALDPAADNVALATAMVDTAKRQGWALPPAAEEAGEC